MTFAPQIIIRNKRDGRHLTEGELGQFMCGLVDGSVSPEQAAALAMAIYFQGMSADETANLTYAMTRSGQTLSWPDGPPVVDKHSSGGIGDKVSLILAPLMAACGCRVPMISGRGLDFTGGTLDKLDSITGYNSQPDMATFRAVVSEVGCAIIGQTADLAPADRLLYAIRDVTATVESLPLITASILSKKISAGIAVLAMDVKCGSGAFCPTLTEARNLAKVLEETANGSGLSFVYRITDMNQPLGRCAGNAIEVLETISWLRDLDVDTRLSEVTLELGNSLLVAAGQAKDHDQARKLQISKLESGHVAERFAAMVAALGGPKDLVDHPGKYLSIAPVQRTIMSEEAGYISEINGRMIGQAIVELGGGRKKRTDTIDHRVGISDCINLGQHVDARAPLLTLYAASEKDAHRTESLFRSCFTISADLPANTTKLIY